MKKGDVVMVNDGSYSRSVVDGKLIHENLAFSSEVDKQYTIIETGCSFPADGNQARDFGGFCGPSFNNTVIQAIDSGKVVFTEERFLRPVPPKHKVMVDMNQTGGCLFGNIVEISDKLYKEIKRGS